MRSITISSRNNNVGFGELMKIKVAARHFSYVTLFHTILILAFLLPFVFILTALVTLEGVNKCSSFGGLLGPKLLGWTDDSKDFVKILNQVNYEEVSSIMKLPQSYAQLVSEMKNNGYKRSPSFLRLTEEYSSNAHARRQLPSPELLPPLRELAASVVVNFAVRSSLKLEKIVFHVINRQEDICGDALCLVAIHARIISPAIVEVRGIHQFDWLTRENIPVLAAVWGHYGIWKYFHGNHVIGANLSDSTPRTFASKLRARSPKYISLLNHICIYLPELFPNLHKVVFLDDDVVIQRDLSPLWDIDLKGKVNGAVETCKGEDEWVMSKRFRKYFNFSHPLIAKKLNPHECAWAYGINIFDLHAWRKTNIRDTYHSWLKENLKSKLTMWKLGTLPPSLIAFRGHVHPIDPLWHMLGLGYQNKSNIDKAKKAAVIHYNGQCKPWLELGFEHLRPFWTKYVDYSNDFIRNCHIVE
ncbi:unnamed protein product [Withania somnifera]